MNVSEFYKDFAHGVAGRCGGVKNMKSRQQILTFNHQ